MYNLISPNCSHYLYNLRGLGNQAGCDLSVISKKKIQYFIFYFLGNSLLNNHTLDL